MSQEHVLVVVKPDGMMRGLAGEVLRAFWLSKLELVAAKMVSVSQELAQEHYRHLQEQEFYPNLVDFLTGKFHPPQRLMAMVYAGEDAVRRSRSIAGATNPEAADPRTLRGSFGRITTGKVYENVVHVSSNRGEAEREIKLWFSPDEIDIDIFPSRTRKDSSVRIWE